MEVQFGAMTECLNAASEPFVCAVCDKMTSAHIVMFCEVMQACQQDDRPATFCTQ